MNLIKLALDLRTPFPKGFADIKASKEKLKVQFKMGAPIGGPVIVKSDEVYRVIDGELFKVELEEVNEKEVTRVVWRHYMSVCVEWLKGRRNE